MPKTVKLSDNLVIKAMIRGKALSRSMAKQIEYWANIGQIAEDNPDLPYSFIRDILIAQEEANNELLEEYKFNENKEI